MKVTRGRVFMYAYLLFLVLAYTFDRINNFGQLPKILLGATIASVFFAFSDAANASGKATKRAADACLDCFELYKMKLSEEVDSTGKVNLKETVIAECEKESLNLQNSVERALLDSKRLLLAGNCFFGAGILIFLLVITFYDTRIAFVEYLIASQGEYTLIAFIIIMANYCCEDFFQSTIDKMERSKKELLKKLVHNVKKADYSKKSEDK